MDKKDYVLRVLAVMKDTRPIAEGLSYLITKNTFNDKTIDVLVNILQYSIHQASNEIEKEKLVQASEIFQKIKQSELHQNKIDQEDITKLEKMIDTF